jgi:riboflavin kinase / FMN adenylyltransferase
LKLFDLKHNQEFSFKETEILHRPQELFFAASSVALGIFDGVHLGHQSIIKAAHKEALKQGLSSAILTFENHPRSLTINNSPSLITDFPSRLKLFKELGIDYVLAIKFSLEIMNMSPDEYLKDYLLAILNAKSVSVGYDHHFGKNRSGNVEFLKEFCKEHNLSINVQEAFKIDGGLVSSSKIREQLSIGNIREANKLLGRNFTLKGTVIHGDGRGKELGFPTANLKISDKLIKPKVGVYLAVAKVISKNLIMNSLSQNSKKQFYDENNKYQCLVNIGYRPTFSDNQELSIEAHLLNFTENLYDHELELEFIDKIRDEKKFSSKEELIKQIKEDIDFTKKFGTPKGIRIPVVRMKTECPRPLDDGGT